MNKLIFESNKNSLNVRLIDKTHLILKYIIINEFYE